MEASTDRVIKRKGRTLLTDKSTRPKRQGHAGVTLDKIPEKSFKQTSNQQVEEPPEEDALTKMRKAKGLTDDEFRFLKEYRHLEELEREKGIKFFECIGDPPATHEFLTGISVKRQNFIDETLDKMREEDCQRFATEINRDKVVVPTDINLAARPSWNVYENNHFAMRRRLVGIFLKVTNKLITRIRAGKRLILLKKRLEEEKI
jgi:hypothetical protein